MASRRVPAPAPEEMATLEAVARASAWAATKAPPLIVTVPVSVLAFVSVIAPVPSLTRLPAEEPFSMVPSNVLLPLSTPMVRLA